MANTSDKSGGSAERVVKVALPIDLIRRMDKAIVERDGGFETRAELIREAIENVLVELRHPAAPPEPGPFESTESQAPADESGPAQGSGTSSNGQVDLPTEILESLPAWERDEIFVRDLAGTALTPPPTRPVLVSGGDAEVAEAPLLGLHNRDYVSLWAAGRLARYSQDDLVPFDEFLSRATNAAWLFAHALSRVEQSNAGSRLTVQLPTNLTKRQAAERGFQHFAIGSIPRGVAGNGIRASGPLFVWGVCQVEKRGGQVFVGLTPDGWQLLAAMGGLSLELPHEPDAAERFLSHLAQQAPGDLWGFHQVTNVVADRPDRESLVAMVSASNPEWTPAMRSSITQGYVARAREWGLVQPRLIDGRYQLTDFGVSVLDRGLTNVSTKEQ